ncbi:MAG: hypothetical protein AB8B73_01570 [Ekhidna sp.]
MKKIILLFFPIIAFSQGPEELLRLAVELDSTESFNKYKICVYAGINYEGERMPFVGTIGNLEWIVSDDWTIPIDDSLIDVLLKQYENGYYVNKKFYKRIKGSLSTFSKQELLEYEKSIEFKSQIIPEIEIIRLSSRIGKNPDSVFYYNIEKNIPVEEFPSICNFQCDKFIAIMWMRGILLLQSHMPSLHIYNPKKFLEVYGDITLRNNK